MFILDKTDLVLPDVLPITLTRTYRQADDFPRPFGIGTTHSYQAYLVQDSFCSSTDLILSDGGRVHFNRLSGTNCEDSVLEHTASPTGFFKSTISWNSIKSTWDLKLKDGTVHRFKQFSQTAGAAGPVLVEIQDRYNNLLTVTRDDLARITQITSPNGRWIQFNYDSIYRITQAIDNIGRIATYTYDASGRLWIVTDPAGGITEYTYDPSHRLRTIKDARGIVFLTNEYDANGRVSRQIQADNTTFLFAYTTDGSGKVTQTDVTDPRGKVRRVTFNAAGYALADTRAVGTPEQQALTYEWQAGTNLLLSVMDALGRQTAYTYDGQANVTSVTRLAGTPEAVTTTMTYEPAFNQVATITDPIQHTTTYNYDPPGTLTGLTNALQQTWTVTLNSAGQPLSITSPPPIGAPTTFAYDGGNLSSITDPLNRMTTRVVDVAGRLVMLSNPLGNRTIYDYDLLNRLTLVTDARQGNTQFGYDPNGNLVSVTDAKNVSTPTTYAYDNMDRLIIRVDALLRGESYTYDPGGNLLTFTDRKNQVTRFDYDPLGRRIQATYQDTSTTTYTYDPGNRLTQIADSISGTITRNYDGLDRLLSETTPQGTVGYTYDAAGRRTSMTVAGQTTVNYSYDNANRLIQITQGISVVSIGYDAAGRRTSLTLPNGIVVTSGFDQASQLTSLTYQRGPTVLGDVAYSYDLAGNRVRMSGSFARTSLPQPVASATYDAANEALTFGPTALVPDANGNVAAMTDPLGTAMLTWDARNRLTGMTASGLSASFGYDALGRRTTKIVNGTRTDFLYDGLNPVQELSDTTVMANLLTGLGVDEYLTRTDAAGARTLLPDALGSTLALTDDAGIMQTLYTYEPFGNTSVAGATSSNSFQYTGRENDGTGLYFYRARYYSPRLQRFIQEDPLYSPLLNTAKCRGSFAPSVSRLITVDRNLGALMVLGYYNVTSAFATDPQLLHLYTYVNNDPLDQIDPEGLIAGPQERGCDVVGRIPGFQSDCAVKCCNEHDDCYTKANAFCSQKSWLGDPRVKGGVLEWGGECQRCNRIVVGCLAMNLGTGGRKPCK